MFTEQRIEVNIIACYTSAVHECEEISEEIQRLPQEEQKTVMDMLRGAVAISDMCRGANPSGQSGARLEA